MARPHGCLAHGYEAKTQGHSILESFLFLICVIAFLIHNVCVFIFKMFNNYNSSRTKYSEMTLNFFFVENKFVRQNADANKSFKNVVITNDLNNRNVLYSAHIFVFYISLK